MKSNRFRNGWVRGIVLLVLVFFAIVIAIPLVNWVFTVDPQPIRYPHPHGLTLLAWNVDGQGTDPAVIRQQLGELGRFDLIALQEVPYDKNDPSVGAFGTADQVQVTGDTGGQRRLAVLYKREKFELLSHRALDEANDPELRHRSPQIVHLKYKPTETEFLLVNNHLARGDENLRNTQVGMLRQWALEQSLPIIAVGDYNLDYQFEMGKGNVTFEKILEGNVFQWIRPQEMIDTNWIDQDGDGRDDYPGSMLDFVFVANQAKAWDVQVKVIVRQDDFPDDDMTSDHRPLEVVVK